MNLIWHNNPVLYLDTPSNPRHQVMEVSTPGNRQYRITPITAIMIDVNVLKPPLVKMLYLIYTHAILNFDTFLCDIPVS